MKFDKVNVFSFAFEPFLIKICTAGYQIEHGGLCTTVRHPFRLLKKFLLILGSSGILCAQLRGPVRQQGCICKFHVHFLPFSTWLTTWSKIRIDSAGTREYVQFQAVPHPRMKPMAYLQGGMQQLMMA
jgi:hypothetical protein